MNTVSSVTIQSPKQTQDISACFSIDDTSSLFGFNSVFPEVGKNYTLGFYAKAEKDTQLLVGTSAEAFTTFDITTEWQFYHVTLFSHSNTMYWKFNDATDYYIYETRLVEGDNVADYSVSPDDTVSLESRYSEIKQTVDNIQLEVAKKVGDDEIISKINLSPEEIAILASKIKLEGYTSINDNFIVTEDGKIKAKDAEVEITGGSINIQTSDENEDKITIQYKDDMSGFVSTFTPQKLETYVVDDTNSIKAFGSLQSSRSIDIDGEMVGANMNLVLHGFDYSSEKQTVLAPGMLLMSSYSKGRSVLINDVIFNINSSTIYHLDRDINANGTITLASIPASLENSKCFKHQIGDGKYQVDAELDILFNTTGLTISAGGTSTLATLPTGFRPSQTVVLNCFYTTIQTNASLMIRVLTNGQIQLCNTSNASVTLSSTSGGTQRHLYVNGSFII